MKRIILHAGPPKTGTSAVQHWLQAHAVELRNYGVSYPVHRLDKNDVSSGNLTEVLERVAPREWRVSPALVERLLKKFETEDCATLLLSSEFFFRILRDVAQMLPTAEFVVYLRDPTELRQSGYAQGVKRHGVTKPFKVNSNPGRGVVNRLRALMEFGLGDRLIIRPYSQELFAGGSIVSDLLSVLGVEMPVEMSQAVNTSYTFEALEFKRHANHFPLGRHAARLDRVLQACNAGQSTYSLLEPVEARRVRQLFVAELQEFAVTWRQPQLLPFAEWLEARQERPWRQQTATRQDIELIGDYVRQHAPLMHYRLKWLAWRHQRLPLPTPHYHRFYGIHKAALRVR